jgi:hypothetical protein
MGAFLAATPGGLGVGWKKVRIYVYGLPGLPGLPGPPGDGA